jgi:hypothetical protein
MHAGSDGAGAQDIEAFAGQFAQQPLRHLTAG